MDRSSAMFAVIERAAGVEVATVRYDITCSDRPAAERIRDVLVASLSTLARPVRYAEIRKDGEEGFAVGDFRIWWEDGCDERL